MIGDALLRLEAAETAVDVVRSRVRAAIAEHTPQRRRRGYRVPSDATGRKMRPLLSPPDRNPKSLKGRARGYATYFLHLAPSDRAQEAVATYLQEHHPERRIPARLNVCPMASPGCRAACLFVAGRGNNPAYPHVDEARIRKTVWFWAERDAFMARLVREIALAAGRAKRKDWTPVFRLNATSDIRWETIPVKRKGRRYPHVFAAFPELQFYDYTKIPNRRIQQITNYHLTFSLAEENQAKARMAVGRGMAVAVVFRKRLPDRFHLGDLTLPVVDGDLDDLRFLDGTGVAVGLKAKGSAAKSDRSGFVKDGNRVELPVLLEEVAA